MSSFNETIEATENYEIVKKKSIILIYSILILITISVIIASIIIFYFHNKNKDTIQNGIYIKGIDVSSLTKEQAIEKVNNEIYNQLGEHIILKYSNCQYYLELEQFEAHFDIESAVEYCYNIGKTGNFFQDVKDYISVSLNQINIEPNFEYNSEALQDYLEVIQIQLPDQLEQSSYYLDGDNLVITAGSNGAVIYTDKLEEIIIKAIKTLSFSNSIYEIPTYTLYPDKIDVQAIHTDIYKEVQNAYYTTDPYMIYPERDGVDFNAEDVEKFIDENPNCVEYKVALTVTKPETTINDIGIEAFPDLLGTYSTKYNSNVNRTTNLRIAASKINSTVIMPGEVFSFNKIVGKRTYSEGYKDAPVFVNGQVENDLAGGICQISSTLYNAVTFANLEVTERRNHSMLTSYSEPGRDATVVWGSSDLKFKNSRSYPIKIYFSVEGGYAKCSIYGLKSNEEYDISFQTNTIKRTSTTLVVDTYKIYKQNGEIVKKEKLHRDTYKT